MIEIVQATPARAADIASLIMLAMTDECCMNFCGPGRGLDDFKLMMTQLVARDDSQYSWRNTLMAIDGDEVVGIATAYDGSRLHELRRAFVDLARQCINRDHSGIDDETHAGELYLDSLAVLPAYRRQGIASRLIRATTQRARALGIGTVGLLVDCGNPAGQALYKSLGFSHDYDTHWGGHPMHHMALAAI